MSHEIELSLEKLANNISALDRENLTKAFVEWTVAWLPAIFTDQFATTTENLLIQLSHLITETNMATSTAPTISETEEDFIFSGENFVSAPFPTAVQSAIEIYSLLEKSPAFLLPSSLQAQWKNLIQTIQQHAQFDLLDMETQQQIASISRNLSSTVKPIENKDSAINNHAQETPATDPSITLTKAERFYHRPAAPSPYAMNEKSDKINQFSQKIAELFERPKSGTSGAKASEDFRDQIIRLHQDITDFKKTCSKDKNLLTKIKTLQETLKQNLQQEQVKLHEQQESRLTAGEKSTLRLKNKLKQLAETLLHTETKANIGNEAKKENGKSHFSRAREFMNSIDIDKKLMENPTALAFEKKIQDAADEIRKGIDTISNTLANFFEAHCLKKLPGFFHQCRNEMDHSSQELSKTTADLEQVLVTTQTQVEKYHLLQGEDHTLKISSSAEHAKTPTIVSE